MDLVETIFVILLSNSKNSYETQLQLDSLFLMSFLIIKKKNYLIYLFQISYQEILWRTRGKDFIWRTLVFHWDLNNLFDIS